MKRIFMCPAYAMLLVSIIPFSEEVRAEWEEDSLWALGKGRREVLSHLGGF
jgi:hypothetical protein